MKPAHRIVVITGASKGLGRQTALKLCRRNPDLVLVARSKTRLEHIQKDVETLTGKKPLIIPCDVSRETDVGRMAEMVRQSFDHVDVLINNAGIGIHKTSEELSYEEMKRQFEVNFYGPYYCIKALLPLLKRSDSPYIVNVSSLVSRICFADNSVYGATKSALAGFSAGLRCELKRPGIKVGVFFPGLLHTTFGGDEGGTAKSPPLMVLDLERAASRLERMILKRKKESYMYRWMLLPMKARQWIMG